MCIADTVFLTVGEESSYGSQSEAGHSDVGFHYTGDSSWDPFAILDPSSDTGEYIYFFLDRYTKFKYKRRSIKQTYAATFSLDVLKSQ